MVVAESLQLGIDGTLARVGAEQFERATDGVARAAQRAGGSVRGLDRSMDTVAGAARRGGRGLNEFDDAAKRTEAAATRLGGVLRTALVGLAVGAGIAGSVRALASFEEEMLTLQGVAIRTNQSLQAQEDQYVALEAAARQAGATTRFTATEAASGLTFLARAGFDANESIAALPATLNLALVGQLELGRASDIASNVLRQFGLQATETSRVVDDLTNVANRSNTNIEQLAQALVFAGPVAGQLGVSLEETASVIGALGDAGIQASLAGTSLRQIMLTLLQPSGEAADTIERLGLSLSQLNPTVVGIEGAFRNLAAAGADAEDFASIFETRSLGAALVLKETTDSIAALTTAQKENRGEAERLAGIIGESLTSKAKALASAWQELTLQTGDQGLTGALKGVLETGTDVLRFIGGVGDSAETASVGIRALSGSVVGLSVALAGLGAVQTVRVLSALLARLNPVVSAITIGVSAVAGLATAFGVFGGKVDDSNVRLATLRNALRSIRDEAERTDRAVAAVGRGGGLGGASIAREANLRNLVTTLQGEAQAGGRIDPNLLPPEFREGAILAALKRIPEELRELARAEQQRRFSTVPGESLIRSARERDAAARPFFELAKVFEERIATTAPLDLYRDIALLQSSESRRLAEVAPSVGSRPLAADLIAPVFEALAAEVRRRAERSQLEFLGAGGRADTDTERLRLEQRQQQAFNELAPAGGRLVADVVGRAATAIGTLGQAALDAAIRFGESQRRLGEFQGGIDDLVRDIQEQTALLGTSGAERARLEAQFEAGRVARQAGLSPTEQPAAFAEAVTRLTAALETFEARGVAVDARAEAQRGREAQETAREQLFLQRGNQAADTVVRGLVDGITTNRWEDVGRSVAQALIAGFLEAALDPLRNASQEFFTAIYRGIGGAAGGGASTPAVAEAGLATEPDLAAALLAFQGAAPQAARTSAVSSRVIDQSRIEVYQTIVVDSPEGARRAATQNAEDARSALLEGRA